MAEPGSPGRRRQAPAPPTADGEAAATGLTLRELRDRPISDLKSVGTKLEERLGEMGLRTVLDLLEHYPRRYHDRTNTTEIGSLAIGEEATVTGAVKKVSVRRPRGRRPIVEMEVYDGTSYLRLTFFNQEYRAKIAEDTEVSVFGKVDLYRGRRQMVNPALDVVGQAGESQTGILLPVYPQSGKAGVQSWEIRKVVAELLTRTEPRGFADPLDDPLLTDLSLASRGDAYRLIHRPDAANDATTARKRLTFDEFLRMQIGLVARKRALERDKDGIAHTVDGPLVAAFVAKLPFPLTRDQERAIADINADLASPCADAPAAAGRGRIRQDGGGAAALLVAVQNGYQGALMAPTEVLAEQHYLTLGQMLDGLTVPDAATLLGERPVGVALLTNRTSAADRRAITEGLRDGRVDILIGTHALIYEGVQFARLGVAVVDEQHRFGVEQRDLLRGKGNAAGNGNGEGGRGWDARRPGHDRDADPAHRRDAHLRRSRPVRAA